MTNKKALLTVLVICIGMFGLYIILKKIFFLILALIIGSIGTIFKPARFFIANLWFRIGKILGFVNSRIILSGIYFLVLTPIALLSRLFLKDKLQLKRKNKKESYFIEREHTFKPRDFDHPW